MAYLRVAIGLLALAVAACAGGGPSGVGDPVGRVAGDRIAGDATSVAAYDPLAIAAGSEVRSRDDVVHDAARGRDIPIRVYLPGVAGPAPVVLFSHGLGGSRAGSAFLGRHWAARGYLAVFVQHPGSDESLWRDVPAGARAAALARGASLRSLFDRLRDVPAVLDALERRGGDAADWLHGRVDARRVGMSGHSFGAITAQALAGQRAPGSGRSLADPRIRAAIIMSPSSPRRGDPARAFGGVAIPWLLMTGTRDLAPVGEADMASRLAVFPALAPGGKYELVLDGAQHSVFTERPLPGDTAPRDPRHHPVILALSTAFWDAWLRGDPAARAWLDGGGAQAVLAPKDRWQRK